MQHTGTRHLGRRASRRQQQAAAARQRRIVLLAGIAIVGVLAALVVLRLFETSSTPATTTSPAPSSVVQAVTGVDPSTLEQVGRGTATGLPTPIRGDAQPGADGLPVVTYLGAEYCPFCAGERWPLVAALGRFGTFTGLQLTHSASDDVFPNTPTFSFVGSSYSSPYVDFSPVELQSNQRVGNGYATLQTPTPAQANVLQTYDAAPYVPAQSAGSIPFIDFGGQYVQAGASYDVGTLRGMTPEQVAASLSDPSSAQAKAILGTANVLTAAICSATGNNPSDVCRQPSITSLQAALAAAPVPS